MNCMPFESRQGQNLSTTVDPACTYSWIGQYIYIYMGSICFINVSIVYLLKRHTIKSPIPASLYQFCQPHLKVLSQDNQRVSRGFTGTPSGKFWGNGVQITEFMVCHKNDDLYFYINILFCQIAVPHLSQSSGSKCPTI